jgi:hypothetical protein
MPQNRLIVSVLDPAESVHPMIATIASIGRSPKLVDEQTLHKFFVNIMA